MMAKAMNVCHRVAPWNRLENLAPSSAMDRQSGTRSRIRIANIVKSARIIAAAMCQTGMPAKSAAAISLKMIAGKRTK
jgi:hypothetical protein